FCQAEDGIRDRNVTGVQTCALPISMVHGGAEFGPRALGNRSILASATLPGITSRVNSRIKNREAFRPFAPVVRKEDYEKWFGPRSEERRVGKEGWSPCSWHLRRHEG